MPKIIVAFVDYDGILANIEKRLAAAWDAYSKSIPEELAFLRTKEYADTSEVYWRSLFRADLLPLDAPIDGVKQALKTLETRVHHLILLTSKPDYLETASEQWLTAHGLADLSRRLVLKPADIRLATPLLKAIQKRAIADAYGATEIIDIDDEQKNLDEAAKHFKSPRYRYQGYLNLQQAVA